MDAVLWAAVGAVGALAAGTTAFVSFWIMVGSRSAEIKQQAAAAKAIAQNAAIQHAELQREFYAHKVQMAAEISALEVLVKETSQAIVAAEIRLVKAMDDLGERFVQFGGRLDRLFESRGGSQLGR